MTGADRHHLLANYVSNLFDEAFVPRRSQADGLGKLSCVPAAVSGEPLFMNHRRDAEPGVLDHDSLDLVHEASTCLRSKTGGCTDPSHVSDAMFQRFSDMSCVKPVAIDELGQPNTRDLSQLLIERHPPEQIVEPLVNGKVRASVCLVQHVLFASLGAIANMLA